MVRPLTRNLHYPNQVCIGLYLIELWRHRDILLRQQWLQRIHVQELDWRQHHVTDFFIFEGKREEEDEELTNLQDDWISMTQRRQPVQLCFNLSLLFLEGHILLEVSLLIWQPEYDGRTDLEHHWGALLLGSYRFRRSSQHTKSLLHQITSLMVMYTKLSPAASVFLV